MRTSSSADLFEQLDAADSDHDQLDHEQIAEFFASSGVVRCKDLYVVDQSWRYSKRPSLSKQNACACAQCFVFLVTARAMDFADTQPRLQIDADYIKWMTTTYRISQALKCYERFLYDQ